MRKNLLFLLLIFMSGCTSPYQEHGYGGGYYHQRINENTYRVTFRGNGFTSYKQTHDYALLRTAEICKQLGFTHFVIEGQEDKSQTTNIDMGSTSYTSGSVYGSTYYGTTNTYSDSMPVTKPRVELTASYFEGVPSGRYLKIYVAEEVTNDLRSKYNLK